MEKTFTYEGGRVTVHGVEHWPSERFTPLLAEYVSAVINGEEEEDAV